MLEQLEIRYFILECNLTCPDSLEKQKNYISFHTLLNKDPCEVNENLTAVSVCMGILKILVVNPTSKSRLIDFLQSFTSFLQSNVSTFATILWINGFLI